MAHADPLLLERGAAQPGEQRAIRYTDDGGVLVSCRPWQDGLRVRWFRLGHRHRLRRDGAAASSGRGPTNKKTRPLETRNGAKVWPGPGLTRHRRPAALMQAPLVVRDHVPAAAPCLPAIRAATVAYVRSHEFEVIRSARRWPDAARPAVRGGGRRTGRARRRFRWQLLQAWRQCWCSRPWARCARITSERGPAPDPALVDSGCPTNSPGWTRWFAGKQALVWQLLLAIKQYQQLKGT